MHLSRPRLPRSILAFLPPGRSEPVIETDGLQISDCLGCLFRRFDEVKQRHLPGQLFETGCGHHGPACSEMLVEACAAS